MLDLLNVALSTEYALKDSMPSGPNTTGNFFSPGDQTELSSGDGGGIRNGASHREGLKMGECPPSRA